MVTGVEVLRVDGTRGAQILNSFRVYPSAHVPRPGILEHSLFALGIDKSGHMQIPSEHSYWQTLLHAPQCALFVMKLTHPLPKQKLGAVDSGIHNGVEPGSPGDDETIDFEGKGMVVVREVLGKSFTVVVDLSAIDTSFSPSDVEDFEVIGNAEGRAMVAVIRTFGVEEKLL